MYSKNLLVAVLTLTMGLAISPVTGQQRRDQAEKAEGGRAQARRKADQPDQQKAPSEFDAEKAKEVSDAIRASMEQLKIECRSRETEHLLVFSDLDDETLDRMAELAESSFRVASRLLKIEDPIPLFPHKLPVVVVRQRDHFQKLYCNFFQTDQEPRTSVVWRHTGDDPLLLVSNLPDERARIPVFSGNWSQWTACWVATALLQREFCPDPEQLRIRPWVNDGFGRYCCLLAQDNPQVIDEYRKLFRFHYLSQDSMFDFDPHRGNRKWYEVHAVSVVEYLLVGPNPEGFANYIDACRGQEEVDDMTPLHRLGWRENQMQPDWLAFARTGELKRN